MGIGYDAKVMFYNSTGGEMGNPLIWYGRELDHVRVELNKKIQVSAMGTTETSTCTVKMYDSTLENVAAGPAEWKEDPEGKILFQPGTLFVITRKDDIGRNVELPSGKIPNSEYPSGFLTYLQKNFGMVYKATSAEHYSLIPHWVVSGS